MIFSTYLMALHGNEVFLSLMFFNISKRQSVIINLDIVKDNTCILSLTSSSLINTSKLLKEGEETIGIINHCIEFTIPDLFMKMQAIDKKNVPSAIVPLYYELESENYNNPYHFSQRELECLFVYCAA